MSEFHIFANISEGEQVYILRTALQALTDTASGASSADSASTLHKLLREAIAEVKRLKKKIRRPTVEEARRLDDLRASRTLSARKGRKYRKLLSYMPDIKKARATGTSWEAITREINGKSEKINISSEGLKKAFRKWIALQDNE